MSDEPQSGLTQFTTEDILSNLDGIPLPPAIKKNLWKSMGRLITGLVDVPVALLEAKVQKIKAESNGLESVIKTASNAAAKEFGQDQFLIDRTVNHFGSKLLREQINRESTVKKAIEELKNDPPKEDSQQEIDPDWLEMFSRIAETKSNEDVQLFLSKILAGEIRNPGTFGARTIQTLATLDQSTAQLFQTFCNISYTNIPLGDDFSFIISEPMGEPGSNGLAPVGLNYINLTQLQDSGLIKYDLNSWREIPALIFAIPFNIGSESFCFRQTSETPKENIRVTILNFTKVGLELKKVLHISSNPTYNEKFVEWVKTRFLLS